MSACDNPSLPRPTWLPESVWPFDTRAFQTRVGRQPDQPGLRRMLTIMGSRAIETVDAASNCMGWIGSSAFGAGRHLDRASRRAFRRGSSGAARRAFHRYMQSATDSDRLFRRIHAALTGRLSTVPMLTIFGERNDPFDFQQQWQTLFPHAHQVVVRGGHHFPMCDAPAQVADAIRTWHARELNEYNIPKERQA